MLPDHIQYSRRRSRTTTRPARKRRRTAVPPRPQEVRLGRRPRARLSRATAAPFRLFPRRHSLLPDMIRQPSMLYSRWPLHVVRRQLALSPDEDQLRAGCLSSSPVVEGPVDCLEWIQTPSDDEQSQVFRCFT